MSTSLSEITARSARHEAGFTCKHRLHDDPSSAVDQVGRGAAQRGRVLNRTSFVRRAVKQSGRAPDEQQQAVRAALHSLRHTHATRFAERGGDVDVLQANLGHADPLTAAVYFRAQIERRQKQAEKAFG